MASLLNIHPLLWLISVQSASNQLSDIIFQYTTTEMFNDIQMGIGWIEFASCQEGEGSTDYSLMYPNGWTEEQILNISKYAVTMKILPSTDNLGSETTDYAVTADVCSNPIFASQAASTVSHFFHFQNWKCNISSSISS
eukprot:530659_1